MNAAAASAEPLADDFFRLCHDDRSDALLLEEQATRIGLASALLGELGWLGLITIPGDVVRVHDGPLPRDAAAHGVLDDLRGESVPRDVRTWLAFLSLDAYERVARRLVAGNHVERYERRRRLLGRVTCYRPTDMNQHAWPRARMAVSLGQRRPLDPRDVHLLGIAYATGLLPKVADWGGQAALEYFFDLLQQAHPAVQSLVEQTRAVVGATVMSRR